MHRFIPLLGLFVATTAAAQPLPTPACRVIVARAPDDVRAAIEQWVERETSCGVTVDVRAVPTEGGYYLIARDEDGNVHERIVPDAASAGVLVASWIASWAPEPPPTPELEPAADAAPLTSNSTPDRALIDQGPVERPSPQRQGHWLALDGLGSVAGNAGLVALRVELDVLLGRHWRLGIAGLIGEGVMSVAPLSGVATGSATTSDREVGLYVTREIDLGPWHVRPAVGLGAMFTTVHMTISMPVLTDWAQMQVTQEDLGINASPVAEASLRLVRDLGADWGLETGVLVDYMPQTGVGLFPATQGFVNAQRDLAVALAFGVRRRL